MHSSRQISEVTLGCRDRMQMQNTLFGVLLPHIGGVVADLGRVFPLAAFFIAVFFLLRQLAYQLFCCQANTWFCEGKLQESQENYLMIQEGKKNNTTTVWLCYLVKLWSL